jgi:hypothetical protein
MLAARVSLSWLIGLVITAVYCGWRGAIYCSGRSNQLSILLNRIDAPGIL